MRDKNTWVAAAQLLPIYPSRTTQRAILVCGCEIAIPRESKGYYHNRCAARAGAPSVAVDASRVTMPDGTRALVSRVIAPSNPISAPVIDAPAASTLLVDAFGRMVVAR